MGKGTYGSTKGRPKKKVVGKRNKLDMNKDGKLTKKDFAMLRNKKKGAKGAPTAANFKRAAQTVRKK